MNLRMPAFRFRVGEDFLKKELFRKRWRQNRDVISLTEFPQTQIQMAGDCCIFNFPRRTKNGRKIFDAFSEWSLRFQIPPA